MKTFSPLTEFANSLRFNPEAQTLTQCLSILADISEYKTSNYKCFKVDDNFESEEWQLKEFSNNDIMTEGNKYIDFHKNYALLVFYGLIQFRNYQANNFNILFLAFSCNILKKHYTMIGERHITKIVDLVYRNFDMKEKSDEYEMFLGKSGKNKLEGKEELIEIYKLGSKDTMF